MKNTDILWFEGGAYKALVMLLILAVLPILLMGCGSQEREICRDKETGRFEKCQAE